MHLMWTLSQVWKNVLLPGNRAPQVGPGATRWLVHVFDESDGELYTSVVSLGFAPLNPMELYLAVKDGFEYGPLDELVKLVGVSPVRVRRDVLVLSGVWEGVEGLVTGKDHEGCMDYFPFPHPVLSQGGEVAFVYQTGGRGSSVLVRLVSVVFGEETVVFLPDAPSSSVE